MGIIDSREPRQNLDTRAWSMALVLYSVQKAALFSSRTRRGCVHAATIRLSGPRRQRVYQANNAQRCPKRLLVAEYLNRSSVGYFQDQFGHLESRLALLTAWHVRVGLYCDLRHWNGGAHVDVDADREQIAARNYSTIQRTHREHITNVLLSPHGQDPGRPTIARPRCSSALRV